jgi:hypothetical protein
MPRLVLLAALLLGFVPGCSRVTGLDVALRWTAIGVDVLEVETSLNGGTPTSQQISAESLGEPLVSPHVVLIQSPPDDTLEVRVTARGGLDPLAQGALAVRPKDGQIVEVTLELLPLGAQ